MMAEKTGVLGELIRAGFRILESACGPCIGMGFAPNTAGVSLRTFNRNFKGRSGTPDAEVYLVSPETAAIAAITGCITDPRDAKKNLSAEGKEVPSSSDSLIRDDAMLIAPIPLEEAKRIEIV